MGDTYYLAAPLGREVKFQLFSPWLEEDGNRNLGNGLENLCPAGYSGQLRDHAGVQVDDALPHTTKVPQYLCSSSTHTSYP